MRYADRTVIPKTLAITVVTSKLAASTPIMTPPAAPRPKTWS